MKGSKHRKMMRKERKLRGIIPHSLHEIPLDNLESRKEQKQTQEVGK